MGGKLLDSACARRAGRPLGRVSVPLPGLHNVLNALSVIAAAAMLDAADALGDGCAGVSRAFLPCRSVEGRQNLVHVVSRCARAGSRMGQAAEALGPVRLLLSRSVVVAEKHCQHAICRRALASATTHLGH